MKRTSLQKIAFTKTLLYHLLPFIVIVLLSIPLLLPYLKEGYFPTHDGEWAVVRLGDMYRELRDGQFPARYSGHLNFGYGYPLFNFAYPLPYYLGAGLLVLKMGLVTSIELLFVFSVIAGVVGMYFLSSHIWKSRLAGVLSAVLYMYFPFRMVDLFVRGSLGDTLASALFPYILLCLYFVHTSTKKLLPSILAGIGFGLLILAHNIMAVLFLVMLIPIIGLFVIERKDSWKWYLGSLLYGLMISAFFWMPALVEKQFIALSQIPIADRSLYFVTLSQLLFSPWGYAPPTETGGFTYQIGWPQLIIFCLAGFFCLKGLKTNPRQIKHIAAVLVLLTVVFVTMMFSISSLLWNLPLLSEINYPWILLLPIGFVISLLAGYLIDQKVWVKSTVLLCGVLAVVLYFPWAKPAEFVNRGDDFYLTNDATTTSSDELMPLWVKEKPKSRVTKVELLEPEKGTIDILKNTSKEITFLSQLRDQGTVSINTIYFPGWRVTIDGSPAKIDYTSHPKGVMQVTIPEGMHRIEAIFTNTPIRTTANSFSVLSLVLLPVLFLYSKTVKKKKHV